MGEPSTTITLIEQVIRLGVPGILIIGYVLFLRGDILTKRQHTESVGDRDKQIAEYKEQVKALNESVTKLSAQQVASVQELVNTQRKALEESAATIRILQTRSEGTDRRR